MAQNRLSSPWVLSTEDIFSSLNTGDSGLTSAQAEELLKINGQNRLPDTSRLSRLKIFLNQLKSPLIFILIIAGFITLGLGEIGDSLVIWAAVLVNSALGFYQENKAENSLTELKKYLKTTSIVIRDGVRQTVDSESLVVGDKIIVLPGDRIPADGRLVSSDGLEVDESILTGESLPAKKNSKIINEDTPLADRSNMVWSGTLVSSGSAQVILTAIGDHTELGRIAELVKASPREDTPLQFAIKKLTTRLSVILAALTTLLFGLGLYYGQDPVDMFITAVAVAVAAIPEGLPIAVTVILALAVERLAKKKSIVRQLLATETLGSTSLILTDKTGTLTEANTSLSQVLPTSKNQASARELLRLAVINAATLTSYSPSGGDSISGRPLEVSIIKGASRFKLNLKSIISSTTILREQPFNSRDRFGLVLISSDHHYQAIFLGAPDFLVAHSSLSSLEKDSFYHQIDTLASTGEKVLGLATKTFASPSSVKAIKPTSLEFKGFLTFRDPVRPSVKQSIQKVKNLGVDTIIVTGDHPGTARAVASAVGLFPSGSRLVTGSELDSLSDNDIINSSPLISVFARVTPEQKLRIARTFKSAGHIIAMTGDGINDAPALKEANIGIAVGSGTEVAKSASDLIILDNNFSTIVSAIIEGRQTVSKIKKVIVYLLSSVVDELALIGGALIFALPIPLSALQILWVNFFSDSFPALGFAFENTLSDHANRPSQTKDNLIDNEMKFLILIVGVLSSLFLFTLYYLLLKINFSLELVRTFIFASFGIYTLILTFSIRSLKRSILSYKNIFDNEVLSAGVGFGLILMGLAIYLPFFQNLLGTVPLPPIWILAVLFVSLLNLIAFEFGKWLYRRS